MQIHTLHNINHNSDIHNTQNIDIHILTNEEMNKVENIPEKIERKGFRKLVKDNVAKRNQTI